MLQRSERNGNNLKKVIILIFIVFQLILLVSGCSSKIYSDSLIHDSEKIDSMYIFNVNVEGEDYQLDTLRYHKSANNEQIETMISLLKNIRLKKLTTTQGTELMNDFDNIKFYTMLLEEDEKDPFNPEPKGGVFVMEDEYLVFVNPKTIDESPEKNNYYISTEKQFEVINEMIQIKKEDSPYGTPLQLDLNF